MKRFGWALVLVTCLLCALVGSASANVSGSWTYSVRYNATTARDEACITKYSGSVTNVTVPSALDGYPVTKFGSLTCVFAYPTQLKTAVLPDSLTSIGMDAFMGCTALTTVTHNAPLTEIGMGAFQSCNALTGFYLPNTLTKLGTSAFQYCWELKDIVIPQSLTSIGNYAFGNCRSLTSLDCSHVTTMIGTGAFSACEQLETVVMPQLVGTFGDYVFKGCSALTSITLPKGSTAVPQQTFDGCIKLQSVTIQGSPTSIGKWAFNKCQALTSIVLPGSVTQIGDYAFSSCTSLASIDLPDGLHTLGASAFYVCLALKSIEIPSGVTAIAKNTFASCDVLETVTLPDTLLSIGESAFMTCDALTDIVLPDTVKTIDKEAYYMCRGLRSVCLPNGLETIGESAFVNCNALQTVTSSAGAATTASTASVQKNAFYRCEALTSVELPDGLATIGASAFAECKALTDIRLPDGLKVIDANAFSQCSKLPRLQLPDGVTTIGAKAFNECYKLKLVEAPDSLTDLTTDSFASNFTVFLCAMDSAAAKVVSAKGYRFEVDGYRMRYTFDANNEVTGLSATGYRGSSKTLRLPDGVTSVDWSATFLPNGGSLTIPEGVTSVAGGFLYPISYARYARKLVLPKNPMNIAPEDLYTSDTIYCYRDTAAEAWANEMRAQSGCTVVLLDEKQPHEYVTMSLPDALDDYVGARQDLRALLSVSPYPLDGLTFDWASSAPEVATVDDKGVLTLLSVGTTTITATAREDSALTASMRVKCYARLTSFDLPDAFYMVSNTRATLPITNVTPEGALVRLTTTVDPVIVEIASDGVTITSYSTGSAVLTVTSDTGVVRTCALTVVAPVFKVELAPRTLSLYTDETAQLTATASSGTSAYVNKLVTFTSDDESIATVDQNGRALGVAPGETTIRATAASGKTAACAVSVTAAPQAQLPNNLTAIEARAFADSNVVVVRVPNGCESIGDEAFLGCARLLAAHIPASVTSIGADAFAGCTQLTIHCPAGSAAEQYAIDNGIPYVN